MRRKRQAWLLLVVAIMFSSWPMRLTPAAAAASAGVSAVVNGGIRDGLLE
ncbi:hypothetical protein [Paenibacillus sp. RC343]|nr:hypothetical protein [Paenibacillus sp. RC343]